jgi:DNA-binding NarL/FixJ family response regulator
MVSRRVVVADDDVLVREGIAGILGGSGWEIVGQAENAAELEQLVRDRTPDVVVTDIRMPPTQTDEGLRAAQRIRTEHPGVGILLLSAHVEVETAMDLLEGGERFGYLLKSRVLRSSDLLDACDRVASGGSVVDPDLVRALVQQRRRDDPLEDLTPREREVLALMAEGRSNTGIASRLFITEGAVEKHVRSILAKLRLSATNDDHRRVLAVLTYLDSR